MREHQLPSAANLITWIVPEGERQWDHKEEKTYTSIHILSFSDGHLGQSHRFEL